MKRLEKAKKEAGIVFHSPGSPGFNELAPKQIKQDFAGPSHEPNPTVDFHPLPDQKKILPHVGNIHSSPNFEEHFTPGNFSKGENSKLVDTPHGQFFAKKSQALHPFDREDFGLDDRAFSMGEREMAYHNAAHHFFGMGKHVPLAVMAHFPEKGEHWTMHKMVDTDKYRHGPTAGDKGLTIPEERMKIHDLHHKGVFPKALTMDAIMGNQDRHDGNVFYGKGDMQLIDHGWSLSTANNTRLPSFYYTNPEFGLGHHRIHPEFRDWLLDLKPDNLNKTLLDNGVPEAERNAAVERLKKAHRSLISATTRGNNYRKFFEELTRSHS